MNQTGLEVVQVVGAIVVRRRELFLRRVGEVAYMLHEHGIAADICVRHHRLLRNPLPIRSWMIRGECDPDREGDDRDRDRGERDATTRQPLRAACHGRLY
jgi:hypothetical protein